MKYTDKKLATIITWMAGFMASLVGLGFPCVYFGISYFYQDAALETEAEINARIVNQLINANPEMWRFEELRLLEVMSRRPGKRIPETRRALDLTGTVVAESAEKLDPPVDTRTAALLDSGRRVGTIEISRSMRPLIERTILLALLGFALGLAAFISLRTFPLRALRRALWSLFEEKERAQVTLKSIADGVIATDEKSNILLMNAAAEKLTGWRQEEARGQHLNEVFHIVNEKTRAVCENPVAGALREMRAIELANGTILIARDGTERVIADSAAPIRGADGSVTGVVLVFRDITEKQKLSEEVQKGAKLESLGVLAGGIAHDFNNILTAIAGNISLALLDTRPEDPLYAQLVKAETACRRAKDLTYQLLTFSKGGTPLKEAVSLEELIRSSSDFALTGSNVRSEIIVSGNLPPVSVDAGQINQVLHNLMINALEAMHGGGIITVRGEHVFLRDRSLPLPPGDYVRISVQDRGMGVPKERWSSIFDPYFTTKQGGSGLGLATCYSIIRNHGGHITVDSEPGKGSNFQFYLPASSGQGTAKNLETTGGVIHGQGKILVMDDEESVRNTAGEMLSFLGYEVFFAVDGAEAIDRYRKARDAGSPFDAVILDLTIRGGMGGEEAVQKIVQFDPRVKAIVSSGYSENPVMSDCSRYGFKGLICKPYSVQQMSHVLHKVLHDGTEIPNP